MKRSRAFILAETLTTVTLQASFLLILCTSFYMMLTFYTRTQKILTAREKGQRVIQYFDQRIRHAGLGMWACNTPASVKSALSAVNALNSANLVLPVAITSLDRVTYTNFDSAQCVTKINSLGHTAYYGNILTLVYAERELSGNFYFAALNYQPSPAGENFKFLNKNTVLTGTNFSNSALRVYNTINRDYEYYAVAPSIGEPFRIKNRLYNYRPVTSFITINIASSINPIDELHYLRCKRIFVEGDSQNRIFKYKNLTTTWGENRPHENDILEIYMELDTITKIFDLYVLSSGGIDSSTQRTKPKNWPGHWKDEYSQHELYLSQASWKLHNLERFSF